ncbi:MAG TPA: hypothetical protein PKW37_00210 [Salinivirgaceae bacterium]|jgi:hypothetical protein|nr:hypothetical protein [Salinivirgaceae bacterium]
MKIAKIHWRKSYQLNKWFEKNIKTENGERVVPIENLRELHSLVLKQMEERHLPILKESENAGDWFWEDMEFTKSSLEKLFESHMEDSHYTYETSS